MRLFRRQQHATPAEFAARKLEAESMALCDPNGTVWTTFPPEVISNLRHMLTQMLQKGLIGRRLALTSTLSGEGVTYLCRALGLILANDTAATVCVVDLNWWTPAEPLLGGSNLTLADAVAGKALVGEVVVPTGLPNLSLMPAGIIEMVNRPVIARSIALRDLLTELDRMFDHLILDVPAILATSDAIALASLADSVVLIVQQNVTSIDKVRLALNDISHLDIKGVILNRVQTRIPQFVLNLIPPT